VRVTERVTDHERATERGFPEISRVKLDDRVSTRVLKLRPGA
jgi:hypothetical protein